MKSIITFTYIDRKYSIFLDLWILHYSKIQNNKLIILYRNEIPQISDKLIGLVELININNKIYNNTNYIVDISIFNDFQLKFLKENDIVIYSDVDELIIHDDLDNLLQTFDFKFLVTTGIEIVQDIKSELNFNFNKNILSQRKYMVYSYWYNKPLILSNYCMWIDGKHNNTKTTPYPDLFLLHLGKICSDIYIKGWEETYLMYPGYKYKNLTEFYNDYLLNWNDINHPIQPMIPIPENIKSLINKKWKSLE